MIKHVVLALALLFGMVNLQAGELIDINSADAATIAGEIKGIGPAKAKAIVKYREDNGPFKSVEALVGVAGIGEKTLERIRGYITVPIGEKTSK